MVQQVLERTLPGQGCLSTVAQHSKHSQATVLDLLQLQLLHGGLSLSEVEEVEERAAWVGGVAAALKDLLQTQEVLLAHRARVAEVLQAAKLSKLHRYNLNEEDGVRISPVAVVRASRWDYAALVPDNVRLLGDQTRSAQDLGGDASSRAEHSPAAVDHLRVLQPLGLNEAARVDWVQQAERVEAEILRIDAFDKFTDTQTKN
ncbi:hypothetical protein Vretifemale_11436 [Volvox reticuliferus]|uniref:Uncharacterized protein n=1 Tax=Volvox reticuliferus TaxID=1737510 RepID=A0A8J4FSE8_9CHLO|nr:hypothetical protein Vretifemale_11436 [Volvox reticuliferus]